MLTTIGVILLALFTWLVRLDHFLYDVRYGVYVYRACCLTGLALMGWAALLVFRNPYDMGNWFLLFGLMTAAVFIVLKWVRRYED